MHYYSFILPDEDDGWCHKRPKVLNDNCILDNLTAAIFTPPRS